MWHTFKIACLCVCVCVRVYIYNVFLFCPLACYKAESGDGNTTITLQFPQFYHIIFPPLRSATPLLYLYVFLRLGCALRSPLLSRVHERTESGGSERVARVAMERRTIWKRGHRGNGMKKMCVCVYAYRFKVCDHFIFFSLL